MTESIRNVIQTKEAVRILLWGHHYIVLDENGMGIGRGDWTVDSVNAQLDWEAADQVARTIMSARSMFDKPSRSVQK